VTSSALQSQEWQLIGISQWCRSALCGHPLPALTDNGTYSAASRHTIAPISHTKPSPRSRSYYSFPVPLRIGGWVGLSTQWVGNLLKIVCRGPSVSRTCNLSITPLTRPILYHYTLFFVVVRFYIMDGWVSEWLSESDKQTSATDNRPTTKHLWHHAITVLKYNTTGQCD